MVNVCNLRQVKNHDDVDVIGVSGLTMYVVHRIKQNKKKRMALRK